MSRRGDNLFKRNDLRRALRSAREEGFPVDRFEIGKDGHIIVYGRPEPLAPTANPWDEHLSDDPDQKRPA
jgi:hypothetical protein